MIFAAGLGTRLKGETENKPKALVEVGEKTLLQLSIEKLKNEGFGEIVVNVHHYSDKIISFLADHNFEIPIKISDETEKLLDTGGGLKKASSMLTGEGPFVIYNVDILSNININEVVRKHITTRAMATLVVRERESERCLKFDKAKNLVGWINKKTGELKVSIPEKIEDSKEMGFSGIHVISPKIFSMMPANQKFSIIDFYIELAKKYTVKGFFDNSEFWLDVGTPENLEEARKKISAVNLFH